MLAVGLRVVARLVHNAVPMIRRRVKRVQLQRNTAGIDDVVIRPGRDDDREAAKELVERVDFSPDLFLGLCTKPFINTPYPVVP